VDSLDRRIATYFSPPLFPIHLSEVPARCTFHDAPPGEWTIGGAKLRSEPIQHPGATVGYRIEADGKVLTYLTDHEPALGTDLEMVPPEWISGFSLASGADVLIHDCQYTKQEYESRFGFGHSSTEHVAQFARKTGADRVVLFHHDPMHTDTALEAIRGAVNDRWDVEPGRCVLAAEGSELQL
jgi:ribonuclease BN (tRNA processing enzyme)